MPVARCLRCDADLVYTKEGSCLVCSQFFRHPQVVACNKCGAIYCIPCLQARLQQPEVPTHLRPPAPRPPGGPEMMHSGGGGGGDL